MIAHRGRARRRWVAAALGCVVATAVVAGVDVGPGRAAGEPGAGPQLARAAAAATALEYEGVVRVEWWDGATRERSEVPVRAAGGRVRVGEDARMVGSATDRWRRADGRSTLLLADGDRAARAAPEAEAKYDLTTAAGPRVAGRATDALVVRREGDARVREQILVDRATGLAVRRVQYDASGKMVRRIGFLSLDVRTPAVTVATDAADATDAAGRSEPTTSAPAPTWGPRRIGDGFERVDVTSDGRDGRQAFYSDGLVSLSVFVHPGEVDWAALPAGGEDVEIAGHRARRWRIATGDVVVWGAGGAVYTCVTDAPSAELRAAVADLRLPDRRGLVERATDFVTGPLRWE